MKLQYTIKNGQHVIIDNKNNRYKVYQKVHCWATRSRLLPVIDVAATIKHHWAGIIHTATTGTTNGILEGHNSLVQEAKAKAMVYRNIQSFINIIYLIGGGLISYVPLFPSNNLYLSFGDNRSISTTRT
ncbi:MAG: transposase [Thermoplasmatales archaeon]